MRKLGSDPWGLATSLVGLVLLAACGDSGDLSGFSSGEGQPYPSSDAGLPGTGGGTAADAAIDTLPPEIEIESSYESPVATGRYVWITNPTSGQVAYVDATTLEVNTVPAGNGPRYMAAVPSSDADVAVVINDLSKDATVLRAPAGGSLTASTLPLGADANAWAISHGGRWAITWTDAKAYDNPDPVQGFQDITVLDITTGAESSTRLSVGYRPVALSFSADDTQAYAVTQDGVSVIELAMPQGPQASRIVPISADPLENPDTRDVSITPDGAYAFVRRDGQSVISIVSLGNGALSEVVLPGPCTDLDLSADGTRALAAVRDTGDVAILSVPDIVATPDQFEVLHIDTATVGSVAIAPAAPLALIYTNATQEERVTALSFDASPASARTLRVHGSVLSVFPSSTGASAIVVHQPVAGAEGAFSVLNIAPQLPAKIVATQAPITAVALTPDGDRAVLAERSDSSKIYGAYLVWSGNQQVDRYPLHSPPIAVGAVVGAKRAYIAQEHPEGRLTFIDLDTGLARTLTGFELGARVVDGS